MLRIKLVRSIYGNNPRNRATVAALGLRRMQQVVEHDDTPSIRGLIHHVKHLLLVETVEGSRMPKAARDGKAAPKPAPAKPEATLKAEKPKAAKPSAPKKAAPKKAPAEKPEAPK
ncbi:MAG: 50S ribosomal protein L30 [Fimbriimonas ginsengisoli]|uniref:50S ribosomal protein L30 n=1 Tax=Fimbriimonas ginsengisoli TaxID=1005039 RepID=A0A931LW80_FIMGI|nr:50S ribosomal protein L30 [Fimbriimonas ginsengisoli]